MAPRPDGDINTLRALREEDEKRRQALLGDDPYESFGAESAVLRGEPSKPEAIGAYTPGTRKVELARQEPFPAEDNPLVPHTGGNTIERTGPKSFRAEPIGLEGDPGDDEPVNASGLWEPFAPKPNEQLFPSAAPKKEPLRASSEEDLSHLVEPLVKEKDPYADALAKAQDDSAGRRLMARLMTAGSMFNKAWTGNDAVSKFERLEKEADLPTIEALKRIEQGRATDKERNALAKLAADRAWEAERAKAEDAHRAATLGETTRARTASEKHAADVLAETSRHNRAMEARPVGGAGGGGKGLDFLGRQHDLITQRRVADFLPKYEERIKDVAETVHVLDEIDRIAPGFTRGHVNPNVSLSEGFKLIKKLPAGAGSQYTQPEQEALNSAYQLLKQRIIRPLAGANLTEVEARAFQEMMNDPALSSPSAQAAFIDLYRRTAANSIQRKRAAFRAGIPQDVWAEYEQNGGVTENHPVFSDGPKEEPATEDAPKAPAIPTDVPVREPGAAPVAPPSSPPPPKPKSPNGLPPGLTVEKIAAAKAEAKPGETVMVPPDGGPIEFVPADQVAAAKAAGYAVIK